MKRRNLSDPIDPENMTPDALAALERAGFSRRDFLKGAGVLIVGFSMAGWAENLGAQNSPRVQPLNVAVDQVDSWTAIASDESVTAYSGKCDFGQGFPTVQHQLVAEELSVPLDRVTPFIATLPSLPIRAPLPAAGLLALVM